MPWNKQIMFVKNFFCLFTLKLIQIFRMQNINAEK